MQDKQDLTKAPPINMKNVYEKTGIGEDQYHTNCIKCTHGVIKSLEDPVKLVTGYKCLKGIKEYDKICPEFEAKQ